MTDLSQIPNASKEPSPVLFAPKPATAGTPVIVWLVAGAVVLVALLAFLFAGGRKPSGNANAVQPLAPYAASLPISKLVMSESANLSGGKYTYIDGHVQNTGDKTVTAIGVQVLFRNEEQLPPQVDTLPLALVRTHDPYIDTQSVGSSPLKPGEEREFRLTFEIVPSNWNQQMPEIHIVTATTK